MQAFSALPEPLMVGLLQGSATATYLGFAEGQLSTLIISPSFGSAAYGVVGSWVAPMVTADPMMQLGAAGVSSAALSYALGLGVIGPVMDGIGTAASLYFSRMISSGVPDAKV